MPEQAKITVAVPKGRILEELAPILNKSNIRPEDEFYDESSRKLIFETSLPDVQVIKVRSFDVATFVSFGAAQIGICGNDVLEEFNYENIYNMIDLGIGTCRLSIAAPKNLVDVDDMSFWKKTHIRVATKYVNLTSAFFAKKGIQAECIKLNGSIELAPKLGLCSRIVDLVSTGGTLKANNMVEGEKILDVSSRLICNKNAYKVYKKRLQNIISDIQSIIEDS
jgi:ATP phosphoribosyltransferase